MFRYFPSTGSMDVYTWMRAAAVEAGLDPTVCALATLDSPDWREETAPEGGPIRILRKRGVLLSDDDRVFSFVVITGGSGRWENRVDRISVLSALTPSDRIGLEDELTEARRVLRGEVFFPPALFSISYPTRDGTETWGTVLSAGEEDQHTRTAFRRDGTIETSPLPEMSFSESGVPHRVPEWIEDPYAFAAEQAQRETPLAQFRCPCCRCLTLMERAAYEICHVCWWEDDGQDDPHADERWGGPNGSLTLSEARENFRRLGAVEERLVVHARPPLPDEL